MPGGKRNQPVEEMEEDGTAAEASGGQDQAMVALVKMMMLEQQKAEVAREARAEEAKKREEVERRKLQEEFDKRQHENNMAVLRAQQDMSEKASQANREFREQDKRRERVLYGMPSFVEGDDLEEYFASIERRMLAAKLPPGDWQAMLEARFSGRIAVAWRDLAAESISFENAKQKLLKSCGYTPKVAADTFFGFRQDNCKGLTAEQLYSRGQQLLRRIVAPTKITGEVEYALLKGWVYAVIPRRARTVLDTRAVEDATSLVGALQDFLGLEGEMGEGQTATFKKGSMEGRERSTVVTCFKCGKVGHKAIDCWGPKGGSTAQKGYVAGSVPRGASASAEETSVVKVICYICGIEGHKSPQCPNKVERSWKGAKPKSVMKIWHGPESCIRLQGSVNGCDTPILLDTGATVSVVSEDVVKEENMTGETVVVKVFGSNKSISLPVATVTVVIGELSWEEKVAVYPLKEGAETEVIYSWNIRSKRGRELVRMVDQQDSEEEINMVTTRSVAKAEEAEAKQEKVDLAEEGPTVKACNVGRQELIDDEKITTNEDVVVEMDYLCISDEEEEVTLADEVTVMVEGKAEDIMLERFGEREDCLGDSDLKEAQDVKQDMTDEKSLICGFTGLSMEGDGETPWPDWVDNIELGSGSTECDNLAVEGIFEFEDDLFESNLVEKPVVEVDVLSVEDHGVILSPDLVEAGSRFCSDYHSEVNEILRENCLVVPPLEDLLGGSERLAGYDSLMGMNDMLDMIDQIFVPVDPLPKLKEGGEVTYSVEEEDVENPLPKLKEGGAARSCNECKYNDEEQIEIVDGVSEAVGFDSTDKLVLREIDTEIGQARIGNPMYSNGVAPRSEVPKEIEEVADRKKDNCIEEIELVERKKEIGSVQLDYDSVALERIYEFEEDLFVSDQVVTVVDGLSCLPRRGNARSPLPSAGDDGSVGSSVVLIQQEKEMEREQVIAQSENNNVSLDEVVDSQKELVISERVEALVVVNQDELAVLHVEDEIVSGQSVPGVVHISENQIARDAREQLFLLERLVQTKENDREENCVLIRGAQMMEEMMPELEAVAVEEGCCISNQSQGLAHMGGADDRRKEPYVDGVVLTGTSGSVLVTPYRVMDRGKVDELDGINSLVKIEEGVVHIEHLRMVGQELIEFGLTLRSEKGVVGKTRFVQHLAMYSALLSPHTSMLSPSVVVWTEIMMEAFKHLKVSLVKLCVLTILHSDASGRGVGATVTVCRDGEDGSRHDWNMNEFGRHSEWELLKQQPRAAESLSVGGDVGISPTGRKEEGPHPVWHSSKKNLLGEEQ